MRGALGAKIRELYEVNAQRKELERKEDELKEWFRAQAKGADAEFADGAFVVKVTGRSKTGLVRAAVEKLLKPAQLKKCLATTHYTEVTVGEAKPEGDAA